MRPVRLGTENVVIPGKRVPSAGHSKCTGPSGRQGCAGPGEKEPEGQRALPTAPAQRRTGSRRRAEPRGEHGLRSAVPLPPHPPAGPPFSGDTDVCLSLSPPARPLPLRTLAHLQWGQEVSALASQLPGWDAAELSWLARGGTEAPLSLLSGPAGTIATLKTGDMGWHACPGSHQAAACPLPRPSQLSRHSPLATYLRLKVTSTRSPCPSPPPQGLHAQCQTHLGQGSERSPTWPLSLGRRQTHTT